MISNFARKIKHYLWVASAGMQGFIRQFVDLLLMVRSKIVRFQFDPKLYHSDFVARDSHDFDSMPSTAPLKIYLFWTGTNAMSGNRARALQSFEETNADLQIVLVTSETLAGYEHPDYPFHPAYQNLSFVHRSDYLRCYFMHVYGGGYSDIKAASASWKQAFEALNASSAHFGVGYRELGSHHVAYIDSKLGRTLRANYMFAVGNGAFIMKPRTRLTADWFAEVNRRLDYYEARLAKNPGNKLGDNESYPIPWTSIMGGVFQPLHLKYARQLLYDYRLLPQLVGFR